MLLEQKLTDSIVTLLKMPLFLRPLTSISPRFPFLNDLCIPISFYIFPK